MAGEVPGFSALTFCLNPDSVTTCVIVDNGSPEASVLHPHLESRDDPSPSQSCAELQKQDTHSLKSSCYCELKVYPLKVYPL